MECILRAVTGPTPQKDSMGSREMNSKAWSGWMVHGMAKGRAWYIEQLKECPPDPDVPVYIGGADCPETVALIKAQIEAANLGIQDIRCVKIGCLIGTYVGPELTLVAWKRK